jgi:glc operon protein GlcG
MKSLAPWLLLAGMLCSSAGRTADIANHASLTLDGAKAIAAFALQYAHEHAAPGAAIAVVDAAGTLLYLEKLDGTFQNASSISIGKARTAVLFGKPTRVFEDAVNKGRYAMLAVPEVAPFTPLMGGVPVEAAGHIVGAVGVSGAASAAQDDEIASFAAAEFGKRQMAGARVQHVPAERVAQAFRKDANLITEDAFRVNASRRDGAGEAEVHQRDTDIFYVTKGSAELVTGGQVVEPRQSSPAEIRGTQISGGDSLQLKQGDVVSIPRGVPHWFKQVHAPFEYYVVKSAAP